MVLVAWLMLGTVVILLVAWLMLVVICHQQARWPVWAITEVRVQSFLWRFVMATATMIASALVISSATSELLVIPRLLAAAKDKPMPILITVSIRISVVVAMRILVTITTTILVAVVERNSAIQVLIGTLGKHFHSVFVKETVMAIPIVKAVWSATTVMLAMTLSPHVQDAHQARTTTAFAPVTKRLAHLFQGPFG